MSNNKRIKVVAGIAVYSAIASTSVNAGVNADTFEDNANKLQEYCHQVEESSPLLNLNEALKCYDSPLPHGDKVATKQRRGTDRDLWEILRDLFNGKEPLLSSLEYDAAFNAEGDNNQSES